MTLNMIKKNYNNIFIITLWSIYFFDKYDIGDIRKTYAKFMINLNRAIKSYRILKKYSN